MTRINFARTVSCVFSLLSVTTPALAFLWNKNFESHTVRKTITSYTHGVSWNAKHFTSLDVLPKKNKNNNQSMETKTSPTKKGSSAFKIQNFLNPIGNPYILVPYFLIWIYWVDYVKTHP